MDIKKKLEWTRNYRKTWKGLIVNIYDAQKQRCKGKDRCLYYSLEQFKEWCELSSKMSRLYINWKKSGYETLLKPSIDRMDPTKGYEFENIQVLTWRENREKGARDKIILLGKKILQLDMSGKTIKQFGSLGEASTTLKINKANIWSALNGKRLSAGGFKWRYVK